MTAGEAIAAVDSLRPNQYGAAEKLRWLQRLDGQVHEELERTHEPPEDGPEEPELPYTEETVLRVGAPYDEELYTAYLFSQIDLHNGEIARYNQSLALLSAAWRQTADALNRSRMPKGKERFAL